MCFLRGSYEGVGEEGLGEEKEGGRRGNRVGLVLLGRGQKGDKGRGRRGGVGEEEGGHFNLWFGYQEPVGSPWVACGRAGGDP